MILPAQPLPIDVVAPTGCLPAEAAEMIAALLLASVEMTEQDEPEGWEIDGRTRFGKTAEKKEGKWPRLTT